jgi:iron(III) transport system substrate-binding protein
MGSQQVIERLRAERANPQADVWFGAPAEIFARAASEGLLDAYRPTWADVVSADAHDAEDYWYGTYLTPEVIAYNSDAVDSASAPQDWDDVLDARWDQKILIRDPIASGSMRAIWAAILIRSIEQTGDTRAGWRWLSTLDARTREYALDGAFLTQKLGRQEGLITLFNMPDVVLMRQRDSVAVKFIIPRSGTPLLVDAIALVRGSDAVDAARQYYEYVTSREAIADAMQRFTRIPARNDLDPSTYPEWLRAVNPLLKPMSLDGRLLADSLDTWMT